MECWTKFRLSRQLRRRFARKTYKIPMTSTTLGFRHGVALAQHTPNTPVELRPPAARLTGRPVITKRRATKRIRQRVVELYQSGRSARYVAGEVGVSRTTVLNILIQSGVERRPVGPVPRAI